MQRAPTHGDWSLPVPVSPREIDQLLPLGSIAARSQKRPERRVSIRLAWPFARLVGGDDAEMQILAREGIGLAEVADPEVRLRHAAAMELLQHAVERTGDPALGLHAAESLEATDLDVLEHVTRTCATLRDAIACFARFSYLLNESAEVCLEEGRALARVAWLAADEVAQVPAANDFLAAGTLALWRRNTGVQALASEVHLAHEQATDAAEYARVFGCRVRLRTPQTALVLPRSALDLPMLRANRALHAAFELHAGTLLSRLREDAGSAARVREIVLGQLSGGDTSMETVARKMAMSVATLRRRLEEEDTSHRQILDEARYQLAVRYLCDRQMATSEVAFLLGFSHVTALHKAFKRWTGGVTPAEFRARERLQRAAERPAVAVGGE